MSSAPGLDLRFGEHEWNAKMRRVDCLTFVSFPATPKGVIPFSAFSLRVRWRRGRKCMPAYALCCPFVSEVMADVGLTGRPLTKRRTTHQNKTDHSPSLHMSVVESGKNRQRWHSMVATRVKTTGAVGVSATSQEARLTPRHCSNWGDPQSKSRPSGTPWPPPCTTARNGRWRRPS